MEKDDDEIWGKTRKLYTFVGGEFDASVSGFGGWMEKGNLVSFENVAYKNSTTIHTAAAVATKRCEKWHTHMK
jgi:hypothetical protein